MTVSVADTKEVNVGDGVTVAFPFSFKTLDTDELSVFLTAYDGVETVLEEDTHYTVELNVNQNSSPGGTVTMLTAPGVGVPLVVMRNMNFARTVSFSSSIPAEVVEEELDRLAMMAQQLKEQLDRSLHVSAAVQVPADLNFGSATLRSNKLVGFSDTGAKGLYSVEGDSLVGPAGTVRGVRIEFDAPLVFRQSPSGAWSHTEVNVSFVWSADDADTETRTVLVEINPETAEFVNPSLTEPSDEWTSALASGNQVLRLTSEYDSVREYVSLAIVAAPPDEYTSDDAALTWTGYGSSPGGNVTWVDRAGLASLFLTAALTATSNATGMTWTAGTLPTDVRPAAARSVLCVVVDGGVEKVGLATIATDGGVTFALLEESSGNVTCAGAFANSGTKGLPAHWNVVYPL